jgi:hypothetical protein
MPRSHTVAMSDCSEWTRRVFRAPSCRVRSLGLPRRLGRAKLTHPAAQQAIVTASVVAASSGFRSALNGPSDCSPILLRSRRCRTCDKDLRWAPTSFSFRLFRDGTASPSSNACHTALLRMLLNIQCGLIWITRLRACGRSRNSDEFLHLFLE